MDDTRKKPEEGGWKLIRRRRRSTKVMMKWEGMADVTRLGGC